MFCLKKMPLKIVSYTIVSHNRSHSMRSWSLYTLDRGVTDPTTLELRGALSSPGRATRRVNRTRYMIDYNQKEYPSTRKAIDLGKAEFP